MKRQKLIPAPEHFTGTAGLVTKIPVTFGVNDEHGFVSQNGLCDQQVKAPGLAGTGGTDNERMAFRMADGLEDVGFSVADPLNPCLSLILGNTLLNLPVNVYCLKRPKQTLIFENCCPSVELSLILARF